MVYCSQCGKQIPQEANYCRHCGAITRAGREAARAEKPTQSRPLFPAPPLRLRTSPRAPEEIQALENTLKELMEREEIPFSEEYLTALDNSLKEGEKPIRALSTTRGELLVATQWKTVFITKEAEQLSADIRIIEDEDLKSIDVMELGEAIRIRITALNGDILRLRTTDKHLAEEFIEVTEFAISMYSDNGSDGFDLQAHHPREYSRAANARNPNEAAESLRLLLQLSMPLIVVYLNHKRASGQTATITELAAKFNIPATLVTLLMPILAEKLAEHLGPNHNLSIFK